MNLWKTLIFKDIEWEDPPRGYYLTKVKQQVLWDPQDMVYVRIVALAVWKPNFFLTQFVALLPFGL